MDGIKVDRLPSEARGLRYGQCDMDGEIHPSIHLSHKSLAEILDHKVVCVL